MAAGALPASKSNRAASPKASKFRTRTPTTAPACRRSCAGTARPPHTRSIALIAEDPDAPLHAPFTHWLLYNLPGNISEIPPAIPRDARLLQFDGAAQGRTSNGTIGYFGPHPPKDDGPHRYHFEVFCLDSPLELGPGATRADVMRAMAGHVLAKGEVVGLYEAPFGSDR